MNYAIFRAAKMRRNNVKGMAQHALREGPQVPNAVAGAPPPQVLAGEKTADLADAKLTELLQHAQAAGQRLRPNYVATVDMLFTTSHDALPTKEAQDQYFLRCVDWVRSTWPTATILTAAVHRDETTPHLQLLLAPTDIAGKFNAKALMGGPPEFRAHQDSFFASCGEPHGLARGLPSKAKHVPVQTLYRAMNAGAEPPREPEPLIELPPAPNFVDRAAGTYAQKERALEEAKARNHAIAKQNEKNRQQLLDQAAAGRKLSPALIERSADRYRAAIRMEELAKQATVAAKAKEDAAKEAVQTAEGRMLLAQGEARRAATKADEVKAAADLAQQRADATMAGAQEHQQAVEAGVAYAETTRFIAMFDSLGKRVRPQYVEMLAKGLKLELVQGKSLIDQVRRSYKLTGASASLDAIKILDEAAQNAGSQTLSEIAWTNIDNPPPASAPAPAGQQQPRPAG